MRFPSLFFLLLAPAVAGHAHGFQEPIDASLRPAWFWNGHNGVTAYEAFEHGTRLESMGTVTYRDMPTKLYTESGASFGQGCATSGPTPPWLGQAGYLQYRFKDAAFECDVTANDTSFSPGQSIEYRFRVIPSGVEENEARHGIDYRFLRVDWDDAKPDTLHGAEVFTPDDPTARYPSFTETIPIDAIANVPFIYVCFQLNHEEGEDVEPPETFWLHLEYVRLLDPPEGTPAPFDLIEGMDGGVSKAISRVIILDDGDAPAPVVNAPGFNWARAPFADAHFDDLLDVPTRIVSKSGDLCAPADPFGLAPFASPGGLYSWQISLSPAPHVPTVLVLRPEAPPPLSWTSAPCESSAPAEAQAIPEQDYVIGFGDPLPNGALQRAVYHPLQGVYHIPLPPQATSAKVWFQALDADDTLLQAAYLRAENVLDRRNGAVLLHQGTQSLIRFLVFED